MRSSNAFAIELHFVKWDVLLILEAFPLHDFADFLLIFLEWNLNILHNFIHLRIHFQVCLLESIIYCLRWISHIVYYHIHHIFLRFKFLLKDFNMLIFLLYDFIQPLNFLFVIITVDKASRFLKIVFLIVSFNSPL